MWRLLVLSVYVGVAGLAFTRDLGVSDYAWLSGLIGLDTATASNAKVGSAPAKKGPPAAPVTAGTAAEQDMPVILAAPGTVEALASVGVRSRVDGQIVEVGFKEGDLVTAGQVLFKLDDRLVLAQIRQAEAAIERDQANLKDAEGTLGRREQLVTKKIVSEAATETARASVEVLKASIAASKALHEMQRTQLDYLTIRAPITGRTGSLTAKLGTAVRAADTTMLVTINQTQPIAVMFAVPQAEIPTLRRALANGAKAEIVVPGLRAAKISGLMAMIDNQVDKQTGTLTAKVTVENADEALWPGQAVDLALIVEMRKGTIAVPASAVLPSQKGMLVWVIGSDNRVSIREVSLDRITGQTAFVSQGLKSGDRVVTDGHIRLAPGSPVNVSDGIAPKAASEPGKDKQDAKTGKAEEKGRRS
jgi:multidrug efflux system membrane fusion protein